jgi:hypothetical protein
MWKSKKDMSIKNNPSKAEAHSSQPPNCPVIAKLLLSLLSAALLSSCAHRYDIMLTNGSRATNVTKPVLNRETGVFTYKDVAGHEHKVSAGRVVDIGPHSSKNDPLDSNVR